MRLRLGECVLDTAARELTREGRAVRISPKAFGLLEALAEARPRAVSKAELRRRLWPEAIVGGASLARLAHEARAALGDHARRPRFVRTVPRFGYALAGAVPEPGAETSRPACALEWDARLLPLTEGENVIGRGLDAAVSLPSTKVSRRHARIVVTGAAAVLEDLGSRNGTFLSGTRLDGPVPLADGDRIGIGDVRLVFRRAGGRPADTEALDDPGES